MDAKEIFLNWLKNKKNPPNELNVQLAKEENLQFNNHEIKAVDKEIITEETVKSAFDLIQRAISK